MKKIIEIQNLNKSFGSIKAVDDLSFSVNEGDLFAFLGLNGAGKSTTISIMCGLLEKDSGSVFIDGRNIEKGLCDIRRELGVVFQSSTLDKVLSVRDNLACRAAMYGICGNSFEKRLEHLSEMLSLGDLLNRTVGKLSGGQLRRVDIARALFHDPKLLILDEPTTGLDPQTRKAVWDVLNSLREKKKMTIFLTTHYMEEAVGADSVVILDNGKIAAEGTPLELKNKYTGDFITLYGVGISEAESLGYPAEQIRDSVRVKVPNTKTATQLIIKHSEIFSDYEIAKGTMEDVFLAVTGKKLVGGNSDDSSSLSRNKKH